MKVTGTKELDKALRMLPEELQKRAYTAVLTAGGRIIANKAKEKVREQSGLLKKSLGIKLRSKGKTPYVVIGARRGMGGEYNGKFRNPTKYAHLVERGTVHSSAYPFLRTAVDESGGVVFNQMVGKMNQFMSKAIDKHKAKGKF